MSTVLEHLRRLAVALADGENTHLGCGALVETRYTIDTDTDSDDGLGFQTVVQPATDDLAAFARDHLAPVHKQAWRYAEGALEGDYGALQPLMLQIPLDAEVRLLRKTDANSVEKICIGRGKRNDVFIPAETISTIHAQIEALEDGRMAIVDCRSSNGTYVNDKRLAPHQPTVLSSGDSVRIGTQHLMYYLDRDSLRLFLKIRLAEALNSNSMRDHSAL